VQQRTGNSGWVDTIWTFSVGLVEGRQRAVADRGRVAALADAEFEAFRANPANSAFFPVPPQKGVIS
jgi:steroid 5-alpha reductase family enzyme